MKRITVLALATILTWSVPLPAAIFPGSSPANVHRPGGVANGDNTGSDGTITDGTGNTNGNNNNGNNNGGGFGNNNGGGFGNGRGHAFGARTSDQLFLRQSAQAGLMEIAMGQLALNTSSNADVRAFAQQLVDDHTAQLQQLQALADALGITLPDTLGGRDLGTTTRLGELQGDRFDRAWTQAMVDSHLQALELHTRAAARARNADVRAYARAQLVPLATHLETALTLNEQFPNTAATRGRR